MPTLASSSQVAIYCTKEEVFGEAPASGARNLKITSESLDYSLERQHSRTINRSRAVTKSKVLKSATSGGINCEFSYGEYDILIASVLQDDWNFYGQNGEQVQAISITTTANTLNAETPTSGLDAWSKLQAGQWFRLVHPGSLNDGRLLKVSNTVAPTNSQIAVDDNTPVEDQPLLAGAKLRTARVSHGNLQSSFTLERQALDIGQYMAYRGMTPDRLRLDIRSSGITELSIDFLGKDVVRRTAPLVSIQSQGRPIHELHTGSSSVDCVIWEGGVPLVGTYVKTLSLGFSNSLRAQNSAYHLDAVGVAPGTIDLEVGMSVYFTDGDLFDKFKSSQKTSLVFSSFDKKGNGYVFTLPTGVIKSWKTSAGSKDQDMLVSLVLTGLLDADNVDPNLQRSIFIDRIGEPEYSETVVTNWWEYFTMPFY